MEPENAVNEHKTTLTTTTTTFYFSTLRRIVDYIESKYQNRIWNSSIMPFSRVNASFDMERSLILFTREQLDADPVARLVYTILNEFQQKQDKAQENEPGNKPIVFTRSDLMTSGPISTFLTFLDTIGPGLDASDVKRDILQDFVYWISLNDEEELDQMRMLTLNQFDCDPLPSTRWAVREGCQYAYITDVPLGNLSTIPGSLPTRFRIPFHDDVFTVLTTNTTDTDVSIDASAATLVYALLNLDGDRRILNTGVVMKLYNAGFGETANQLYDYCWLFCLQWLLENAEYRKPGFHEYSICFESSSL